MKFGDYATLWREGSLGNAGSVFAKYTIEGGEPRYAVALHMMYYNFVRIHAKLRVMPAMAAGVSDRLWEINDNAALVEAADFPVKKRGIYKKRQV